MKKMVIGILVAALLIGGCTSAALIANARKTSVPNDKKLDAPKVTVQKPPSTTPQPEQTEPPVQPDPPEVTVFGQDDFPDGEFVFSKDDFVKVYATNGSGAYRLILFSDEFKPNTRYGFSWSINPHVLDTDNLNLVSDGNGNIGIAFFIGDWSAAVQNGTNVMSWLTSTDFQNVLNNHYVFETGANDTQILFCPFDLSNESSAPDAARLAEVFQYIELSVFELGAAE